MAFVSRFAYDVFVSYATIDDDPLIAGDDASRWVRTLKGNLQTLLDQKLGRRDSAAIWMDIGRLQGNEPLTPDIHKALGSTALVLVVLSEGYLASAWCRQERESFLAAAKDAHSEGRIFIVHRDEIPREHWPPEFGDLLGYSFFEKDPADGSVHTLAVPKPDPAERAYYSRLDRLRSDIAEKLKELQREADTPRAAQAASARAQGVASEKAETKAVVFLAETTPDLTEEREQLATYLQQSGLSVLPSRYYDRAIDIYQDSTDRDLAACVLFVQLLGPYASWRTDELPGGYDGLQLARAQAASKPIFRWRSRDLDLGAVHDPAHRSALQGEDVMAMDLEEFKRTIRDRVTRIQAQKCGVVDTSGGDFFILVSAGSNDLPVADGIASRLESNNIGFDIIDEDTSIMDVAESDDYDGVVVVYGDTPQEWVQQRVRECRRLALKKKTNAPVCSVYIGPPHDKPPLRSRPPRFLVINEEQDGLAPFLDAVAAKGTEL